MKLIRIFSIAAYIGLSFLKEVNAQAITGNPFAVSTTDNFTYDGQSSPNYGVKWAADSESPGGYTMWASGFSGMKLFTNRLPRLSITAAGNVGIGTTSPQTALEVIGNIKGNLIHMSESSGYIGFLGRGASFTGGWSATPDVLALSYFQRDFAIGGWRKSDGLWNGASLYINSDNGYTGIGTTSPDTKMHVMGDVKSTNGTIKTILGSTSGSIGYAGTFSNNSFCLYSNSLQQMTILTNGNVLIGKSSQTNAAYKLDVGGSVRANKVVVNTTGADFVFDSSYQLPSLKEVEAFITSNKHLPGIASAAQMQQEGLDVGEHQTRLLQKTEELTLYIIQQNKVLANQSKLIEELRQELQVQKNELQQLKNNNKQN